MKTAVRFLCALSVFFLFCAPRTAFAAVGGWFRVENDGVVFFKQPTDSDSQKLFLLEKSYYVYASAQTNGFLQISLFDNTNGFTRISGYVKADEVTPCDAPALPYYPTEILTVGSSNAILKSSPDLYAEDVSAVFAGQNVRFFGRAWQNSEWLYVKHDNDFGYVQSRQLSPLLIAPHPTPLTQETPEPPLEEQPEPPADETQDDFSPLGIVLIVLICIPAVVIVLLLFMPQSRQRGKDHRPPKPKYLSADDAFDDLDLL